MTMIFECDVECEVLNAIKLFMTQVLFIVHNFIMAFLLNPAKGDGKKNQLLSVYFLKKVISYPSF